VQVQGAELPGTADCSVSTKALINQSSESVVLSYRPPGLTDDDGAGALDAGRVSQHAEVDLARKIAAHARKKHPVHLTVVARVAAGHAEAHQKASVPSRCGKDARGFRGRLDSRLTVDHLSDPDVLPFRFAATDLN